jgi:AcrR family transcriptional regulator
MNQVKPIPLRQQQRDYTRQRLVDAARDLFLRNGTRGTSVDDIAKAAGTSRATFYAHFTDKQDVIREMARGMWETTFALYERFGTLKDWSHASIGGWLRLIFDAWDRDAASVNLVVQEMPGELQAEFLDDLKKRVGALMSSHENWRRFAPDEAERRAVLLVFQLERGMSAVHWGGWPVDRDALLETLTDIWVSTLHGDR